MKTLSDEELSALERHTNAATAGPWYTNDDDWDGRQILIGDTVWTHHEGSTQVEADSRFITSARTGMPRLIEELKTSRRRIATLTKRKEALEEQLKNAQGLMDCYTRAHDKVLAASLEKDERIEELEAMSDKLVAIVINQGTCSDATEEDEGGYCSEPSCPYCDMARVLQEYAKK